MIKDFETYISEGRLGRIMTASKNEEDRKEDMGCNISKLQPIDLGLSVQWADRNLILDREKYISFEDACIFSDTNGTGWRLPTYEECNELFNNEVKVDGEEVVAYVRTQVGEIKFPLDGYEYYRIMDSGEVGAYPCYDVQNPGKVSGLFFDVLENTCGIAEAIAPIVRHDGKPSKFTIRLVRN